MNARDVDSTSSRVSWGLLISAISALTAWAYQRFRAQPAGARAAWGAYPTATPGPVRAGAVPRDATRPRRRPLDEEAGSSGSALSQLRADFSRYPPKELAKRIWSKISEDEVTTLSTAFAYHWVFAIPPLLILIVMIAALINSVTSVPVVENLRDLINDRAPSDSRQLLLDLVDNAVAQVGGNLASFGAIATALVALWAASNGVAILVLGFNRAYGVEEERPFIRKKLITIGLTLALVLFINVAFALLVFGQQIGEWIADWVGLGSVFDITWSIARWPVAIVGIMLLLAVLYWAGPNVDQPFRWVTLGSAVATVLWLALVAGFGLYLAIADPGSAWGVVGSVVVLLIFLNFTGIIFFLGAEISAIVRAAIDDEEPAQAA